MTKKKKGQPSPSEARRGDNRGMVATVWVNREALIGLRMALAQAGSVPFMEEVEAVLSQVETVLEERGGREVLDWPIWAAPTKVPPRTRVMRVVEDALLARQCLKISYIASSGERTHRLVEPVALTNSGHAWVLRAWCFLRQEERVFRMERITWADAVVPGLR